MHLCPEQAHALLPRIDPGRLRFGLAVGLRDGAILDLVAAGLSAVEIAALKASEVTMQEGRVVVYVNRQGGTWSAVLATDLGPGFGLDHRMPPLFRARARLPRSPRPAHPRRHPQSPRPLPAGGSEMLVALYACTSAVDQDRGAAGPILADLSPQAARRGWEVVLECSALTSAKALPTLQPLRRFFDE